MSTSNDDSILVSTPRLHGGQVTKGPVQYSANDFTDAELRDLCKEHGVSVGTTVKHDSLISKLQNVKLTPKGSTKVWRKACAAVLWPDNSFGDAEILKKLQAYCREGGEGSVGGDTDDGDDDGGDDGEDDGDQSGNRGGREGDSNSAGQATSPADVVEAPPLVPATNHLRTFAARVSGVGFFTNNAGQPRAATTTPPTRATRRSTRLNAAPVTSNPTASSIPTDREVRVPGAFIPVEAAPSSTPRNTGQADPQSPPPPLVFGESTYATPPRTASPQSSSAHAALPATSETGQLQQQVQDLTQLVQDKAHELDESDRQRHFLEGQVKSQLRELQDRGRQLLQQDEEMARLRADCARNEELTSQVATLQRQLATAAARTGGDGEPPASVPGYVQLPTYMLDKYEELTRVVHGNQLMTMTVLSGVFGGNIKELLEVIWNIIDRKCSTLGADERFTLYTQLMNDVLKKFQDFKPRG